MKLEKTYDPKGDSGNPTLNKDAMNHYVHTLKHNSRELKFIESLLDRRQFSTDLSYMMGYRRFGKPIVGYDDYAILHPSNNPTGTATLRMSMSNPNNANISTQDDEDIGRKSLRYHFGPSPGREWWTFDAKNIELRIPAYESGEEDFIDLFEKQDEPPYFGSNHLLIAHLLFPEEFNSSLDEKGIINGEVFKKNHKQKYKRTKNGDFAITYQAINKEDGKGTADRAYGIPGAQSRIESKFWKLTGLSKKYINFAEKNGFVESLPDRTVDSKRGYPLLCKRTEYGKVLETTPFNYHVQSTACWVVLRAMIMIQDILDEWRSKTGFDGYLIANVHDEVLLDFPRSSVHPKEDIDLSRKDGLKLFRKSNLWRAKHIQREISKIGYDLVPSIPLPFSMKYIPDNWYEEENV
jgi:hypothetical protein